MKVSELFEAVSTEVKSSDVKVGDSVSFSEADTNWPYED